jgi:hypothetical protein
MRRDWIMSEREREDKRKKIEENRRKKSTCDTSFHNGNPGDYFSCNQDLESESYMNDGDGDESSSYYYSPSVVTDGVSASNKPIRRRRRRRKVSELTSNGSTSSNGNSYASHSNSDMKKNQLHDLLQSNGGLASKISSLELFQKMGILDSSLASISSASMSKNNSGRCSNHKYFVIFNSV